MEQPPDSQAVDVVRIMKEIREAIQEKRRQGQYTEEEVESLAEVRRRAWADAALIDPKLLERLMGPSHDWNLTVDYLIRTTRTGLFARLLVLAKQAVRPFVRLYTDHLFNRQAQLNLYFYYLLLESVRESARHKVELLAIRHRCEALERERAAGPGEGTAG